MIKVCGMLANHLLAIAGRSELSLIGEQPELIALFTLRSA